MNDGKWISSENVVMTKGVVVVLLLWLYDIMHYTTSSFGAAEPSAPDPGFEIDPDVV
jgi:hypothetical protein